jgi:hypothetical protein
MVGVLNAGAGPRSGTVDITRQGLRDLGYVEGQTIAFDVRFAGMKYDGDSGIGGVMGLIPTPTISRSRDSRSAPGDATAGVAARAKARPGPMTVK